MPCLTCGVPTRGKTRCPEHTVTKTAERGYGAAHQRERARWVPFVDAGLVYCWRCHGLIAPGSEWDLGHSDTDRSVTHGPEHARSCNRATNR